MSFSKFSSVNIFEDCIEVYLSLWCLIGGPCVGKVLMLFCAEVIFFFWECLSCGIGLSTVPFNNFWSLLFWSWCWSIICFGPPKWVLSFPFQPVWPLAWTELLSSAFSCEQLLQIKARFPFFPVLFQVVSTLIEKNAVACLPSGLQDPALNNIRKFESVSKRLLAWSSNLEAYFK